MTTRGIVQARMLSSRLRGKSLMAVNGVPLLYHTLESVKGLGFLDEVVVATTTARADDPIVAACASLEVTCVRGDSENVLSRFVAAAEGLAEEDVIVRFTADNPIYNRELSGQAFAQFTAENLDYLCVDGLSHLVPEYVRVRSLREIDRLASTRFDREHVTPYLRKNRDVFAVAILPRTY
ncbi:MAG: NTP transferase domain-containing protein, partial [Bacteroidota bacterium]